MRWFFLIGSTLLATAVDGFAAPGSPPPADLRLEWAGPAAAIEGSAGQVVELRYWLRNVGGRPAFAVVLRVQTALGTQGQPVRLEPGPRPGEALQRTHSLALAAGMLEVCVEGVLQNLSEADPPDPNPRDNRICREIRVGKRQSRRTSQCEPIHLPAWTTAGTGSLR